MATTYAPSWGPDSEHFEKDGLRQACVHELFEAQVERTPDAIAAIEGPRQWTYRQLNARANQLARYLKKRGSGRDVPVGVSVPRSLELAATLLGVMKAGGACLPLDPEYPAERLSYMQGDAQAPVVLVGGQSAGRFAGTFVESIRGESIRAELIQIDEAWADFAAERDDNLTDPERGVRPDDLAYVIYTSGSTGRPRGVELPHGGL